MLLPFGFQARAAFLALCEELLVAAGVNVYLAVCKLGHGGDHLVEEAAVVRDRDDGAAEVAQPAFEPLHALRVQMVRGFVEQQHVGPRKQQRRQRDAHLPAARELARETFVVALRPEAEALEDLARLHVEAEAALGLELALEPLVLRKQTPQLRRILVEPGHAVLRLGQSQGELLQTSAALQIGHQRQVVDLDQVLRQIADIVAVRHRDGAVVVLLDPRDHAQQCSFARAVVADQPHAAFGRHKPVDPVKDDLLAESYLQTLYL